MQDIREIDIETELGKYLLMAISKITSESQTDKTPNEVLAQLSELKEKVFTDSETYGSKGSDEHIEHNLDEITTSSQTEISDEEIEKAADKYVSEDEFNRYLKCFEEGAKWYREQLKCKGSSTVHDVPSYGTYADLEKLRRGRSKH